MSRTATKQRNMYTVKKLANLAGISVRTLHYYDEIGLLNPSSIGENGYRFYEDEALFRLQQILFYRELELSLDEIRAIVAKPDFDLITALQEHKQALVRRVERLNGLMHTIDNTINHLKGNQEMSKKSLFAGFTEEEEKKYTAEAEQMYDPATVRDSQKKWKAYSKEDKQRIGEEGDAAYAAIVAAIPLGADSPQAQAGVELWRKHMEYFWSPNLEQLNGLAELYNTDARFKANFDKFDPRLAEFMREAVEIYVKIKKGEK
jgi:MerR family transcriptional regulator, thiopeptide resistance regulator